MKSGKPAIRKSKAQATRPPSPSAWKIAEAFGVDMALLEANMKRTPYERIQRHQLALNAFLMLRDAGRGNHAR